jgi:hypothetical protein
MGWRGIEYPERSETLELVLIYDNRHATPGGFVRKAHHTALALHQNIAIGTQCFSGHRNCKLHGRSHFDYRLRSE